MLDRLEPMTALRRILTHYRASTHTTTKKSSMELMTGRPMRIGLHTLKPIPTWNDGPTRRRVEAQQQNMKRYTDQRRGARCRTVRVRDRVRRKWNRITHKLKSRLSPASRVTRQLGEATF